MPQLLAAPVLAPDQTSVAVYLPRGVWTSVWNGTSYGSDERGGFVTIEVRFGSQPYPSGVSRLPVAPNMGDMGTTKPNVGCGQRDRGRYVVTGSPTRECPSHTRVCDLCRA